MWLKAFELCALLSLEQRQRCLDCGPKCGRASSSVQACILLCKTAACRCSSKLENTDKDKHLLRYDTSNLNVQHWFAEFHQETTNDVYWMLHVHRNVPLLNPKATVETVMMDSILSLACWAQ